MITHDPFYCAEKVKYGGILAVARYYWLTDEGLYRDHVFVGSAFIGRRMGSLVGPCD